MSDPRFARLHTDPRFRRPKRNIHKVLVDERFKAIFEDEEDSAQKSGKKKKNQKSKAGRVDKYGRPISASHDKDNLRRFYRLEDEVTNKPDSEDDVGKDEIAQTPGIIDYARGQVLLESSDEDETAGADDVAVAATDDDASVSEDQESDLDDGEVVLGRHASKPIPVLAENDEYLEVDLNEDEEIYSDLDVQAADYTKAHTRAKDEDEGDEEPEVTGIKTNRIAVVNLDWDHVRASHLYKIFSSLVSPTAPSASIAINATTSSNATITTAAATKTEISNGHEKTSNAAKVVRGKVLSVRVYPSEFGKERLKKEEVEGPPKEIFKKSRRDDILGSLIREDEGDPFDEKALRRYQLERLRYYYAIVTCDTVEAATHIVSELDGAELESSANVFDLSFVPDDMTFDDEFRDEATPATEATAAATYRPLDFTTDALRHSKVTLKWDEDDPEMSKVTRRALSRKEIEEGDYRAYIASSSSEGEGDDEGKGNNLRGEAERERLRELLLGGGGASAGELIHSNPFANDKEKGAEGEMEITFMPGLSEANAGEEETTIEKYKRKQKEKRLARKKEKKEGTNPDEEKEKKTKKPKALDDDFFAAGSESEGNLEEEDNTAAWKNKAKKKSHPVQEGNEPQVEEHPATKAELELLVTPDDMSSSHNHFDMKAILKAEKAKGKKRGKKRNKDKQKGAGDDEIQEDFHIDVKDERFKALHEDHTFAIDPSNPHFKKTKNMAALLEERAKRQSTKEPVSENKSASISKSDIAPAKQSLQSLVESVKRKSSNVEGKGLGKRRKL